MIKFFLYLILLLVLPDFLIWLNYTRVSQGIWRTALLLFPSILTLGCMVLQLCQVRVVWLMQFTFLLFICIAVPKVVFIVVALLGKLLANHQPEVQQIFVRVGLGLAFLMFVIQTYGAVFGWRKLQVERPALQVSGVPPSFKGYRIVQISDLHLGTYGTDTRFVKRLVDSVNACRPDLIVFSGDLINTSPDEIRPFIRTLHGLKATDGVYSILGNHDYCVYGNQDSPATRAAQVKRVVKSQKLMNWRLLLNEHVAITRGADTLYLAGVENIGKPPFPKVGSLSRALQGIPQGAFTVLLSHDPWHWRHGVVGESPVSLTLSGHTHALQMQVGSFSPAKWLTPEWGGVYQHGRQLLYVSTGVGGSIPYRLGAWPQVDLIEL